MRHVNKVLSVIAATMLVAACTDNGIFNPNNDASGTYQLTVYAGKSMPNATFIIQPNDPDWTQYPNGATFVVSDGDIVMQNNGTFVETNNYVITPNGGGAADHTTFTRTGTWTLNGQNLTLSVPAQNGFPSVVDTGTLINDVNGRLTINYQEQNQSGGFDSFEYKM